LSEISSISFISTSIVSVSVLTSTFHLRTTFMVVCSSAVLGSDTLFRRIRSYPSTVRFTACTTCPSSISCGSAFTYFRNVCASPLFLEQLAISLFLAPWVAYCCRSKATLTLWDTCPQSVPDSAPSTSQPDFALIDEPSHYVGHDC